MMPYSQQFWHKYHDQATMLKTSQAAPGGPRAFWSGRPQQGQGYAGSSIAVPGHQLVVPSSGTYSVPGPQHMPLPSTYSVPAPQHVLMYSSAPAGLPEQQGPALQPAVEYIDPAVYRR